MEQAQISKDQWKNVKDRILSLDYEEICECSPVKQLMKGIKKNIDSLETRDHLQNKNLSYGSYVRMLHEISKLQGFRYEKLISQRTLQYPHRLGCSLDALTRLRHYHQNNKQDVRGFPDVLSQAKHYVDFTTYLLTQTLLWSSKISQVEGDRLMEQLIRTKADWGQLPENVINKERERFLLDARRFMYFRSTSSEPSYNAVKEAQRSIP